MNRIDRQTRRKAIADLAIVVIEKEQIVMTVQQFFVEAAASYFDSNMHNEAFKLVIDADKTLGQMTEEYFKEWSEGGLS